MTLAATATRTPGPTATGRLSRPSGDSLVISGGAAGEYCYRFSASNACGTTEAEVTVFVVPEQDVDAQPDVEVQLCAPVTFDTCLTATVSGLPGSCISWSDLGGNVLGTGNELCVTPPVGDKLLYCERAGPGLHRGGYSNDSRGHVSAAPAGSAPGHGEALRRAGHGY